jgi:DNA repair protein RecO (recombination protein O)
MDERATGLILRTRPLTETSLIVQWLTAQCGRVATVAKGARRPKSPFRGKLDLFFECDFTFRRSRRSELHTLCEVGLRDSHAALREDLGWLEQASYAAALIEQATETDTPLPVVFELMRGLIAHLPKQPAAAVNVLGFEVKLLAELGLKPALAESRLSEGSRQLLDSLVRFDWAALGRVRLSLAQAIELSQFLHGFLIYHLGRIPRGRQHALALKA